MIKILFLAANPRHMPKLQLRAEADAGVQGWINHVRYGDTWNLRTTLLGKMATDRNG